MADHHSEEVSSPSTTSVSSSQADRSRQGGSRRRFSLGNELAVAVVFCKPIANLFLGDEMDPDLQLAIERSMMESTSNSPAVGSFDDHRNSSSRCPSNSDDIDGALINHIDVNIDEDIEETEETSEVQVQVNSD